tara:strand:- start:480 stop:902 length:423 start_codon:yes stop_codon:yes gene_type:complete
MALIREFTIPNTGLTVPDAYHLINEIRQEKRLEDIPLPKDSSRADGVTADGGRADVDYKKGYIGHIALDVYTSKEARDEGKFPIGAVSVNPTDVRFNGHITSIDPCQLRFFIDMESDLSITEQAYAHLKSGSYYLFAKDS